MRDFQLNIVETPWGDSSHYTAHVIAPRFDIEHSGSHEFDLFSDNRELKREVDRLNPWLNQKLFPDANWRFAFVREHPELRITGTPPGS